MATVACAIPAMLESMCFSPQATSQNGTAALNAPRTKAGRQCVRSARAAGRDPIVTARYGMSRRPARSARAAIIGAGSMSSTATLMKTYDTPQIAASRNNMGQ